MYCHCLLESKAQSHFYPLPPPFTPPPCFEEMGLGLFLPLFPLPLPLTPSKQGGGVRGRKGLGLKLFIPNQMGEGGVVEPTGL